MQAKTDKQATEVPTGDSTMHMVHLNCPAITNIMDEKVIGICGAETEWVYGDPLKCPICAEMAYKPTPCPMCGEMMFIVINP